MKVPEVTIAQLVLIPHTDGPPPDKVKVMLKFLATSGFSFQVKITSDMTASQVDVYLTQTFKALFSLENHSVVWGEINKHTFCSPLCDTDNPGQDCSRLPTGLQVIKATEIDKRQDKLYIRVAS